MNGPMDVGGLPISTARGDVIAFVDHLGYIYCLDCHEERDERGETPVRGAPHDAEPCDRCGRIVSEVYADARGAT